MTVFIAACTENIRIKYRNVGCGIGSLARSKREAEVGVYKRKILREKVRKHAFDQERK